LVADPDNETQSSYDFTVIVTDKAGNSSEESYSLVVNDLDDASPTVTFENAIASIDENTAAGPVIVNAIADDSGDNIKGGVKFRLAEGSDSALSIDAETGAVTLTESPNFEDKEEYSFAVIATDAAGNASDAKAMTLRINNLDEVAPTITSGVTSIAIDENSGAGQVIFTPEVDDKADISAGVSFSLSGTDADKFNIDASSGAVTLLANPDAETKSAYSFAIT
ncbi:MAG: cadherin repeat domain-containing protein, partial [Porticoccaceae bacterium]